MSRQVALLRGVNLGGRKVVMSELRAACEEAGFTEVETLIASGNLVLGSKLTDAKLEAKLEKVILEKLGLKTDVYVRTGAELEAIIAANPFKVFAKKDPSHLMVYFMRAPVSPAEWATLDETAQSERWGAGEKCLYITYPNAVAGTKLKLPKLGTARNWNTVNRLAAMAQS
ncbi:MAG: DUF1697 domain-containing protein [Terricaulis sp.]